ncbi:MAG: hypothetical protein QOI38_2826 [Sphingomonadales bacterium]|jgi:uncharacterized membrane protein|nr:hypothetical protein [Sphingomonadales bacterium]
MRPSFHFLPLLLAAAGCAQPRPYAPVRQPHYTAIGAEPFWLLTVGAERILLSFGREGGGVRGMSYRRTGTTLDKGVRRWEGGDGTAVIGVEAWRRPCRGAGGAMHEDVVRVRLSGRELNGCGGRILAGGPGR